MDRLNALHRLLVRNVILIAAAVICVLCWPMMCGAQTVGPTPQPQGIPVTHFTADYQFIDNPAYNRERGPVSVFGLGLHVQY